MISKIVGRSCKLQQCTFPGHPQLLGKYIPKNNRKCNTLSQYKI